MVDEYEGETLSGRSTRTSIRPLTLGDLESFFNGAWSIFDVLDMNFNSAVCDLEKMQRFVVGIESQFYSQIDLLYRARIREWATSREPA